MGRSSQWHGGNILDGASRREIERGKGSVSWEENGSWSRFASPSLWLYLKTRGCYYSSLSQLHRWKELHHGHVLLSSLLTALLAPEVTLCSWALHPHLLSAPFCSFCCFFLFFAGCFIIQTPHSDFNCAEFNCWELFTWTMKARNALHLQLNHVCLTSVCKARVCFVITLSHLLHLD